MKVIGFITLPLGIILLISGITSFFNFSGESFFIKSTLAFILIAVGSSCLRMAYMGKVARYTASEMAPVKRDTINYMIDGTEDEVVDLVQKIKGGQVAAITCPYCGDDNDGDAIYCDHCGRKLKVTCSCGTVNQAGSRFCKKCGRAL